VRYVSVCGNDESAEFAKDRLKYYGVAAELIADHSRPTTLKQRYRAKGKTLLRVSELKQHEISDDIAALMLEKIGGFIQDTSLVIFSDFNYGCLPQSLVDQIAELCQLHNVPMFADSQSSSQVGDITRFKRMTLVTPTEHEVRLALGDSTSGLVVLAEKLAQKARCEYSFITLGSEGAFVHSPTAPSHKIITDALPAMNQSPKDVAGAGDSMLTCTAMALVAGANIWEAAFLGSIAAACQVGRVGNRPLSATEVIEELDA
ncbi:MAG: ADP-heptose synthase, partial [Cytophaga sp.]|nr:ADP-heptose synthase [Undibacterium sp.]